MRHASGSSCRRTPPAVAQPCPQGSRNAVAILESSLDDAKAGKLVNVAVAGITEAGIPVAAATRADSSAAPLGAVTRLAHRLSAGMGYAVIPDDDSPDPAAQPFTRTPARICRRSASPRRSRR